MRKILVLIVIYTLAGWINWHTPSEEEIQVKYQKLMNFANEQYQVTDEENFSLASENKETEIEVENKIEKVEEKFEIQEKNNENENVSEKVEEHLSMITQPTQPQEEKINIVSEDKNDDEVVETNTQIDNYQETTIENQFPTVEEHKEIENVETFVENNQMEQKIIDYINNHPSENMSKYGYTVVVDNSITDLTTGFTFTEVRAESLLRFKAGTIKVYAQDYLVNGNLQWTQCYIF